MMISCNHGLEVVVFVDMSVVLGTWILHRHTYINIINDMGLEIQTACPQ